MFENGIIGGLVAKYAKLGNSFIGNNTIFSYFAAIKPWTNPYSRQTQSQH